MPKLHLDDACELAVVSVGALSGPRKGALLFIKTEGYGSLKALAIRISRLLGKQEPAPIYLVQGTMLGEQGRPFSKIKKAATVRLLADGQIVTETGGLIFPQDRPIVLVIEAFECLSHNDQRAYAHLVDGEGGQYGLYEGSVLIAGLNSANPEAVEPGALNRGIYLELE
ncbi:MAG: hypothetical protein ACJ746_01350 [Bryobacteraceae bacterium]